jgi:hypothetical protein
MALGHGQRPHGCRAIDRAVHTRRQSPALGWRLTPVAVATHLTGSGYHRTRGPSPRRSDLANDNSASGHVTMCVAFVLSGGASLGASQAGMLQALYEHGMHPDLLVGTSGRSDQRCVHRFEAADTEHGCRPPAALARPRPLSSISHQSADGRIWDAWVARLLGFGRVAAAARAAPPGTRSAGRRGGRTACRRRRPPQRRGGPPLIRAQR